MMEKKAEVITRPSLVIGLGGTGHESIRYLKRLFLKANNGKFPDLVRLLCLDTTTEVTESIQNRNGNEVLLATNEFWNLGGYNVDRVVQNIQGMMDYKESLSWFPKELRPGQVDQGAQITRPIGRLSLLLNEKKIREIIQEAINSLHLIWKDRYKSTRENMDIYVISSLCGGTGSGMFLDIPYITQVAADEEKIQKFQTIGVFLLASAFSTKLSRELMRRAEANSYAALKELDYFMDAAKFDYTDWQGEVGKLERKPYDVCYLLDTTNENELKLEDQSSAMQVLAESLFLKISTQIGRAGAQRENNIFRGLGKLADRSSGKLTAYSSFGVAFETYPVDEIITKCSNRLTRDVINNVLLKECEDKDAVSKEADNFLRGEGIVTDHILERLMTEEQEGKIEKINVKIGMEKFKGFTDAELVGVLRNFVDGFRREKIAKFNKTISNKKEELVTLFSQRLKSQLEHLIDEGHKGLPRVKLFAQKMQADFSKKQAYLREMRDSADGIKSKLEGRERYRENLLLQIEHITKGIRLRKHSKKVQRLRDDFLGELMKCYNMELKLFAVNQAEEIFRYLLNFVNEYLKNIENISNKITLISSNTEDKISIESGRKDSVEYLIGRRVLSDEELERVYQEQIRDREKIALEMLTQAGGMYSWKDKSVEEVLDIIVAQFKKKFDVFRKFSIEDILSGKIYEDHLEDGMKKTSAKPGKNATEILMDLYQRATPFWVYDAAIMDPDGDYGEKLAKIAVVGTADDEKSIFKDVELHIKTTITSTKDPSRIAIDRNHHGLPLYALWGIETLEHRYEALVKKNTPLHIFVNAASFPKITRPLVDEVEADRRELHFILAKMFGVIYQRGLTFFIKCPHRYFDEIEEKVIGEGIEKARDAMMRDISLIQRAQESINKKVEEMGNEKAKEFLWKYLRENRDDFIEAEMDLVVDYINKL